MERIVGANGSTFYWNEACSICFERRCDFSFPHCQDQFCISCIEHYFNELISNSWGLPVCTIKCPVCYDVLPKSVWSKYVSREMLARYERFNQPYRSFSRFCASCGHETYPTPAPSLAPDGLKQNRRIVRELLRDKLAVSDEVRSMFESASDDLESDHTTVADIFELMIAQLSDISPSNGTSRINSRSNLKQPDSSSSEESLVIRMQGQQPEKRRRIKYEFDEQAVAHVMAQIVAMERVPEKWRSLQHAYVRYFPKIKCDACGVPMCLQCGEANWHDGYSCEDYSAQLLQLATLQDDVRETLRWKLQNSKRCPACAVMINREEGCNKVDCLHCGHEFCWMCLQAWSKSCGFYRCSIASQLSAATLSTEEPEQRVPTRPDGDSESDPEQSSPVLKPASVKPEVGVPNVEAIHRKLSLALEQSHRHAASAVTAASASAAVAPGASTSSSSYFPSALAHAVQFELPLWKDWALLSFMLKDILF